VRKQLCIYSSKAGSLTNNERYQQKLGQNHYNY